MVWLRSFAACGSIANPGPIAGEAIICQGVTGVGYSVAPVANATGYNWTLPPGATVVSGNNTNAITVNYSTGATSGSIAVNGMNGCGSAPPSQLPVTVNPLPVANAGPDVTIPYGTSITLHASAGGSGTLSYHWSPEALLVNPNLQDPQTVNLTATTVFILLVTNQASLCEKTDDVVVTITGGPLHASPVSIPNTVCKGTPSQLFANAGGGSGTYTYTWSSNPPGNPPWNSSLANPTVFPDVSTTYLLNLSDGFNGTSGNTSVLVHPLPTAFIQGGDTLCGSGNSTILTVDLTGSPPWLFYYSNGITTWLVQAQYATPYIITATEPGVYTVLAVSDEHCAGTTSGSAPVAVFPIPPAPSININGTEISSTGCCGNQWYRDGIPIPGATGQNYEPLATAHYFTIVTVDGCSSDTSNTIYYFMTGIRQPEGKNFSIEPNPAENYIIIKSSGDDYPVGKIVIYSITGKTEAVYADIPVNERKEMLIDLQNLFSGMYFISIETKSGNTIMKLIVK